jgi:hypothetical protein
MSTLLLLTRLHLRLKDVSKINPDIQVSIDATTKGVLKAAACTLVGAIFLGPVGLLIGGTVGGGLAFLTSEEFKPVVEVLNEMNEKERNVLLTTALDIAIEEFGLDLLNSLNLVTDEQLTQVLRKTLSVLAFKVK